MKLSFSLASKSSSKPKVIPSGVQKNTADDGSRREYVTQFDPSKTLTDSKPKHVIPPKENEWRPYKKMKNLNLPIQSNGSDTGLQFELEAFSGDLQGDGKISYGLNLRQNEKDGGVVSNVEGKVGTPSEPVEQVLLQSLKNDLKRLPEDRGFEEFEDVPVEGFGAALLAGYGWTEGRGIGKNAKEDVKVREYKKWSNKEGLGFDPDISRVRDSKSSKKEKGKLDQIKEIDGENDFSVGKDVRIIAGRHMGLKGRIVEKVGVDSVVLKLSKNEEEAKVRVNEIADLGSREEEKCMKKLKELKIREERQTNHKEKDKQVSNWSRKSESADVKFRGMNDRGQIKASREKVSWLRSHIRVRIISQELKGGRLYLKKGEVVDVVGPTTCDIAMDETRELIQGVDQKLLETALPRRGGAVLVLYGRHKGAYGNLVEKDLDREIGVVRDADNHELLNVKLEQISEYMGDPSDIGY